MSEGLRPKWIRPTLCCWVFEVLDAGEKKRLKETGVQVHTMSDIDRHGVLKS